MAWIETRSTRSGKSYRIIDRIGGKRTIVGTYHDKGVAKAKKGEHERNVERGDAGLLDPYAAHRGRSVREHIGDYTADLEQTKHAGLHVYNTEKRLLRLVDECGWSTLEDVTADAFVKWRARSPRTHGREIKGKTLNQYLERLNAFCNWCVRQGRLPRNPVDGVTRSKVHDEEDGGNGARAFSPEELGRLLAIVPHHHQLFYRLAVTTGLRVGEIRGLQWADIVDLGQPTAAATVRAAIAKNRRKARQALTPEVCQLLRERQEAREDSVVDVPELDHHKAYVTAAGIQWRTPEGIAGRHALRHTFITQLSLLGVPLAIVAKAARHSDPRLTAGVYTHAPENHLAGTIAKMTLPPLPTRPGVPVVGLQSADQGPARGGQVEVGGVGSQVGTNGHQGSLSASIRPSPTSPPAALN